MILKYFELNKLNFRLQISYYFMVKMRDTKTKKLRKLQINLK